MLTLLLALAAPKLAHDTALLSYRNARGRPPIIFIHIQKNGGDSIQQALGIDNYTGQTQFPASPAPGCEMTNALKQKHQKHANASLAKLSYTGQAWDNAFKFAIVRNPYDRAVSWWSMWTIAKQGRGGGSVDSLLNRCNCYDTCSFDYFLEFCGNLIAPYTAVLKGVGVPQESYLVSDLPTPRLLVDYVGRMEELEAHFAAALHAAGYSTEEATACAAALPHIAHSSSHDDYRSYYVNATTRARADHMFAEDCEALGYTFDGYHEPASGMVNDSAISASTVSVLAPSTH